MERFDAIVVGAGPAGSTAAFRLSRAGARVLLVDREHFPRDKPCGGGLTYRAVRGCRCPWTRSSRTWSTGSSSASTSAGGFERSSDGPLILMTQRRRLDAHLAERAAAAGADFRDGVRAREPRAGARRRHRPLRRLRSRGAGRDRSGRRQRSHRQGAGPAGDAASRGRARRKRALTRTSAASAAARSSISAPFRVGTHGRFRRATTSTSVSAAGSGRARACASTSPGRARGTPFRPSACPTCAVTGCRCADRVSGRFAGGCSPSGTRPASSTRCSGDGIYEALVSARLAAEAALNVLAGRSPDLEPYAAARSPGRSTR